MWSYSSAVPRVSGQEKKDPGGLHHRKRYNKTSTCDDGFDVYNPFQSFSDIYLEYPGVTGNLVRDIYNENLDFMITTFGMEDAKEFIYGLVNMWRLFRSILPLDPQLIKQEGERLQDLYELHFPWAEMCPTIHKILAHGWWLVENMPETLVVGMLSEEGMEHNNKSLKFQGSKRVFLSSRKRRLTDLTSRQLIRSSPPVLMALVEKLRKTRKSLQVDLSRYAVRTDLLQCLLPPGHVKVGPKLHQ